ncbi:hypothetical protein PVAND_000199 [Polypedilum vanderplanki]|uniref:Uncharacterized protein n=1 Tax=Polypedilum vanderplanki TaxID=319348 RepID=A0A9J6BJC3_POLVA|nr:hypothetical protein PVAND_000199 [Polypedilum vanderplanki]
MWKSVKKIKEKNFEEFLKFPENRGFDADIDNVKLHLDHNEKSNFSKETATRQKESFNDFVNKGFKDIQPNYKEKFEP